MAEPVRKIAPPRQEMLLDDEEPGITLLRWVEGPGGTMEQVEMRLTPEIFLNPQFGDQIMYGERHSRVGREIAGLLESRLEGVPDVVVFFDLKLLLRDRSLPDPGPDVMVVRGIRPGNRKSFDVRKERVRPSLIVEVVSPRDSTIRKIDLEKKPGIYEQARIPEYVIVDSTLQDDPLRLLGYRLDGSGRYQPIEPDASGRILSETASVWFQVSRDGERVLVFEHPSGRRVLNLPEQKKKANREAEARRAAEEENARLRAELERLRRER
ncbi:MAG TPA: Uma2 family endonuclease [Thermoanaerobaculia bacterium]|nr:Uma2 family endonuclease [Thermoanaerobaculia bacterium]